MGEGAKKKNILSTIILTSKAQIMATVWFYTVKHARVKNMCIVYQQQQFMIN